MRNTFSFKDRKEILQNLENETYDVLIIGGGITGAGIALDAVSRGMKTALIEKGDFASGTSSKSTKLIHGGLRYLKHFDFWLVYEVGSERAIVHKLAPHLVVPKKMILPIIEGGTYGTWLTSVGLKIYDLLAHVSEEDKRKMLTKNETLELEPLLLSDALKGAGYYAEYRTDDARLTLEVIKTAAYFGASILNYSEVKEFIYENNKVNGVRVFDTISEKTIEIKAKYIVNAAGPWVDSLREKDDISTEKQLQLTKGIHIVVDHEKLPLKNAIYFDAPDGRMLFAIPRENKTYIGTTDTKYDESLENIKVSMPDVLYLLHSANHMFYNIQLSLNDIEATWAGLRPLILQQGKSASEISRKDEIFVSKSGLISIAGGKLTGYRKMAERVVDLLSDNFRKQHRQKFKSIQTHKIPLTKNKFKNNEEVEKYIDTIFFKLKYLENGLLEAKRLVHTFGKQTDEILKIACINNEELTIEEILKAEIQYSIENEMVIKPEDFVGRRTSLLLFNIEKLKEQKELILNEFSNYFSWNEEQFEEEKKKLDQLIYDTSNFY
ncbi:glycerol-3-phosphate dehydrogenase/oxidase [Aureivirga sp. CE67]|uniref:glycerol-3-phosphate dehydrogenase/oxidase n=1 Tax=Aureivirga sp. CE67 TaxID=1788983 RepID=UPI0018C94403|nr:glycerol-3-phosphate dehydrogenase/oxidase [Aureivirga sp. CE67]